MSCSFGDESDPLTEIAEEIINGIGAKKFIEVHLKHFSPALLDELSPDALRALHNCTVNYQLRKKVKEAILRKKHLSFDEISGIMTNMWPDKKTKLYKLLLEQTALKARGPQDIQWVQRCAIKEKRPDIEKIIFDRAKKILDYDGWMIVSQMTLNCALKKTAQHFVLINRPLRAKK